MIDEIDWQTLGPGNMYPCAYEGREFSCNLCGNVFTAEEKLPVKNPRAFRRWSLNTRAVLAVRHRVADERLATSHSSGNDLHRSSWGQAWNFENEP